MDKKDNKEMDKKDNKEMNKKAKKFLITGSSNSRYYRWRI